MQVLKIDLHFFYCLLKPPTIWGFSKQKEQPEHSGSDCSNLVQFERICTNLES